jgi:IS5 family transposase
VKKGRPFHGYRAHFATDRNGFLTDYVFDTASTSEHAHFDHLARNETSEVYADSGCRSEDRIRAHRKRGVKLRFVCRRVRGQAELTRWQKRFNRAVSQVRAFVEHPLARIKSMLNQNGKARYRTMRRNATDFCLSATVTNLCRSLFHLKSATA